MCGVLVIAASIVQQYAIADVEAGKAGFLTTLYILLVPLSAFDRAGHRIGYGAGHYDRAIDRLKAKGHRPKLIGIAFDCQEVASVPAEPHDVALDAILTESGFRLFQQVS